MNIYKKIVHLNANYWNTYIKYIKYIMFCKRKEYVISKRKHKYLTRYKRVKKNRYYRAPRGIRIRNSIKNIKRLHNHKFKLLDFYYFTGERKIKKANHENKLFEYIMNSNVYN